MAMKRLTEFSQGIYKAIVIKTARGIDYVSLAKKGRELRGSKIAVKISAEIGSRVMKV